MKLLCYRGVFYLYTLPVIKKEEVEQFLQSSVLHKAQHLKLSAVPESVRVLRYRGCVYLQEIQLVQTNTSEVSNSERNQLKVVNLSDNSVQSKPSNSNSRTQVQRMGFLYRLYCLGWRNGSLKYFPPAQHRLLSLFFQYRRGFAEGDAWRQDQFTH